MLKGKKFMNKENFEICKEEAKQFLNIAKYTSESIDNIVFYMYPFAVNAMFSCELFLKAILICEQTQENIRTHKIRELFDMLPQNVQTDIKKSYSNNADDLDILIDEISNKFVEWRYAFEKAVSINVDDTMKFAEILSDYAESIKC